MFYFYLFLASRKKISLVTSRLNIGCIIPNIVKATAAMSRKDTKRCYWSNGRVQNTFGAVPDKKTVTCLTKVYSLNLPNQPIEQWLGWSWTIFEEKKEIYG